MTPRLRQRNALARPTIGLLIDQVVGGAQSGRFWSGVADVATARNANVLCFAGRRLKDPDEFNAQANVVYELVDEERLDGVIIWASAVGGYLTANEIRCFCARFQPLPMVSVGMALEGIPSIVLESYQGMRDAIIYLIEAHGRRRLALIRGPEDHREASERYRAYCDAVAGRQLVSHVALSVLGTNDGLGGSARLSRDR